MERRDFFKTSAAVSAGLLLPNIAQAEIKDKTCNLATSIANTSAGNLTMHTEKIGWVKNLTYDLFVARKKELSWVKDGRVYWELIKYNPREFKIANMPCGYMVLNKEKRGEWSIYHETRVVIATLVKIGSLRKDTNIPLVVEIVEKCPISPGQVVDVPGKNNENFSKIPLDKLS